MAKPNFTLPNKPAIKSGSILSYNYTDDFTFVPAPLTFNRDSAATLVNSQGLIEEVGYFSTELVQNGDFSEIGAELVTNGDFATDSDWTKGTGITISNGKANFTGNANTFLTQSGVVSSGKTYKATFTVSNYVSGAIDINLGGSTRRGNISANGTYIFYITVTSGNILYFQEDFSNGFVGSIDNVSVKEVGQNWTFGTGWSMGDGEASCDGTQTSTSTLQTSVGISGIQNELVSISFEISNYSAGLLDVTLEGSGQIDFNDISSNGVYSAQITSSDASPKLLFNANADFIGSIDNISVIEVLGDKPRIDYSDSLTEPSLLLEPQSTNLIPYSEDFSNSYWRKDKLTVIPNSIISPTGELNASLIKETSYTSSIPSIDINSPSSLGAGTYTFSFYVKNNNGRYLGISFGSSSERVRTNFDFNTNTFKALNLSGSTTGTASFTTLGNFYRISITATFPSATVADAVLTPLATDTYPFFAFQDSDNRSFYLWGAQVEALSYASSYVSTAGSTATRLGETANNAGDVNVFNSEEGVLYAEFATISKNYNFPTIRLYDGTNNNAVRIFPVGLGGNNIQVQVDSGGSISFVSTSTNNDPTQYNKIAVKYQKDNFSFYINGTQNATDSSGNAPIGLNKFEFQNNFFGKVRNVQVFNKALTDRELEILTIQ